MSEGQKDPVEQETKLSSTAPDVPVDDSPVPETPDAVADDEPGDGPDEALTGQAVDQPAKPDEVDQAEVQPDE